MLRFLPALFLVVSSALVADDLEDQKACWVFT